MGTRSIMMIMIIIVIIIITKTYIAQFSMTYMIKCALQLNKMIQNRLNIQVIKIDKVIR